MVNQGFIQKTKIICHEHLAPVDTELDPGRAGFSCSAQHKDGHI